MADSKNTQGYLSPLSERLQERLGELGGGFYLNKSQAAELIRLERAHAEREALLGECRQQLTDAVLMFRRYQREFGQSNFTDRHDDSGRCRRAADRIDALLARLSTEGKE